MPAVMAMANAPQNVTRVVARMMFAPPAFAPTAPSRARKPRDAMDTTGPRIRGGDTTTMSNGMAAPMENVAADVRAACTGRAAVISEMPSSSRAWTNHMIFLTRSLFALDRGRLGRVDGLRKA